MRYPAILIGLATALTALALPVPALSGPVEDLVREVNAARKEQNLAPVAADAKLMRAAGAHARDMADNDHFDHRGSDGSRLGDRLKRVGFEYKLAAENIGAGLSSAHDTVRIWMDSAFHRKNLLNPQMCRIGVGYVHLPNDGGRVVHKHYWSLVLARPPGPFCPVAAAPAATPSPKAAAVPSAPPPPAQATAPAAAHSPAR